jgi:hypothetical protein
MLTSSLSREEAGAVRRKSPSSDLEIAFPVSSALISMLNRRTGKQSQCIGEMAASEHERGKLDLPGQLGSDPSLARVPQGNTQKEE